MDGRKQSQEDRKHSTTVGDSEGRNQSSQWTQETTGDSPQLRLRPSKMVPYVSDEDDDAYELTDIAAHDLIMYKKVRQYIDLMFILDRFVNSQII